MSLWLRLIHWVARQLPRRDILAENCRVYLERYRVLGWMPGSRWRGPSVYLHRFVLPDQDIALHNQTSARRAGTSTGRLPGSKGSPRRAKAMAELLISTSGIEVLP